MTRARDVRESAGSLNLNRKKRSQSFGEKISHQLSDAANTVLIVEGFEEEVPRGPQLIDCCSMAEDDDDVRTLPAN